MNYLLIPSFIHLLFLSGFPPTKQGLLIPLVFADVWHDWYIDEYEPVTFILSPPFDKLSNSVRRQPPEKQSISRGLSDITWRCHSTPDKRMVPCMTQCTDTGIIHQSETAASPWHCPGFHRAPLAKGLLSRTLLMVLKLNAPLFLHRWTRGASPIHRKWRWVVGGGERGPGWLTPLPVPSRSRRFIHHMKVPHQSLTSDPTVERMMDRLTNKLRWSGARWCRRSSLFPAIHSQHNNGGI